MKQYSQSLWNKQNNIQLVLFRIAFGFLMALQSVYSIVTGEVARKFIDNNYNFTFIGFEFLNVLHGDWMYYYYIVMGLVALFVSAGLFYRCSTILLASLWTAVYLADKTHYNNHFYLMVLLCWLLVIMPANRRLSLDVQLKIVKPSSVCYKWQLHLFIFQVSVMYFFAAIAKMNADWLQAIPVRQWLFSKTGLPVIGWALRNPIVPWIVAYGGLLFDLLIIPGLLYKRTRWFFFILSLFFHAFNSYVFRIGTFPYIGISLSIFFFSSSFFLRLFKMKEIHNLEIFTTKKLKLQQAFLLAFVLFQLWLPLRHYFIAGNVSWTEERHRMAWRMMSRSKSGKSHFKVIDKANDSSWILQPITLFSKSQLREIAVLPDVTWQAAQTVKEYYKKQNQEVEVYSYNWVRLNHREPRLLIDTSVNLANTDWNYWGHNKWINH